MLNFVEVTGNTASTGYWRYWLLSNIANALTVFVLVGSALLAWKLLG